MSNRKKRLLRRLDNMTFPLQVPAVNAGWGKQLLAERNIQIQPNSDIEAVYIDGERVDL